GRQRPQGRRPTPRRPDPASARAVGGQVGAANRAALLVGVPALTGLEAGKTGTLTPRPARRKGSRQGCKSSGNAIAQFGHFSATENPTSSTTLASARLPSVRCRLVALRLDPSSVVGGVQSRLIAGLGGRPGYSPASRCSTKRGSAAS